MPIAPNKVTSILKPITYTTDDFINDTITFNIDDRFRTTSVVKQLDIKNGSQRDGTDKLIVDFGKEQQAILSVRMFSPTYDKNKSEKHINSDFIEFPSPEIQISTFSNLGPSQTSINTIDDYVNEEL